MPVIHMARIAEIQCRGALGKGVDVDQTRLHRDLRRRCVIAPIAGNASRLGRCGWRIVVRNDPVCRAFEVFELSAVDRPPEYDADHENQRQGQRNQQIQNIHQAASARIAIGSARAAAGAVFRRTTRIAFNTTTTELAAIPMPAIHGVSQPPMASGKAIAL